MDRVYVECAKNFGWDKETVDKQDAIYLKKMLLLMAAEFLMSEQEAQKENNKNGSGRT